VKGGVPCWGNVATSISKMVAQFEFLPILDMILLHLKHYNPKSAYSKLGAWSKNACSSCGEDKAICECKSGSQGGSATVAVSMGSTGGSGGQ
jgi:hypothetical protein